MQALPIRRDDAIILIHLVVNENRMNFLPMSFETSRAPNDFELPLLKVHKLSRDRKRSRSAAMVNRPLDCSVSARFDLLVLIIM
jgi:hypothetical protein